MVEAVCFYTLTTLMLAAACSVVFNRRPIHSVLSLLLVMLCLASLFVMLQAYVVAALQVILYAGAVLVLFLFAIMLLNLAPEALTGMRPFTRRAIGTVVAGLLGLHLARIVIAGRDTTPLGELPSPDGSVEALGRELFTTYLLPFELTSFLILAALVGTVTLAKQRPSDP
jgi:NADH-quinone oxidoreductase subunit J